MMPPASRKASLGKVELDILKYVADHDPASVREVADHVARTTGGARTTVLTVMERLRHKGFISRRKEGGIFRYSPRISITRLLRRMVRDFVDRALGGSLAPFVAYMARDARVSDDELAELRRLVRALDEKRKEGPR